MSVLSSPPSIPGLSLRWSDVHVHRKLGRGGGRGEIGRGLGRRDEVRGRRKVGMEGTMSGYHA